MSETLNETQQATINNLLQVSTDEELDKKLKELDKLCDDPAATKLIVADLVARMKAADHGATRTVLLAALVRLNVPETAKEIAWHLENDESERMRYRAAAALAKIVEPSKLKNYLKKALKDDSTRVKATALRLLIESGFGSEVENGSGQDYTGQLIDMAKNGNVSERWAAFKALRNESGHQPLPEEAEKELIKVMVERLQEDSEWRDIRYQAALALGDVEFRKLEAANALSETLKRNPPVSIRRNCIESLAQLNRKEAKDALLQALNDNDIEIRLRAAEALKKILNKTEAINFIIEDMLRQKQAPQGYIDALRYIDGEKAAEVLTNQLLTSHPDVAKLAAEALTGLGGAEAIRTLQAQREQALQTYTTLLGDADKQIMRQFHTLMRNARLAFRVSMWMHGLTFAIGLLLLLASLYLAIRPPAGEFDLARTFGLGAGGGIVTLLTLFYKDPLKNIGHSVNRLVKVNVVFLGYVRQINQIDATFKHMFLSPTGFGTDQMKSTVEQIQTSVSKTLVEVKTYLIEPDD